MTIPGELGDISLSMSLLAAAGTADGTLASDGTPISDGSAAEDAESLRPTNDNAEDNGTRSLAVKVSTYSKDEAGDAVLDTAMSRLGHSISDAVVTVGDSLVLSRWLRGIYSEFSGLDAEGRMQRLVSLAGHVHIAHMPMPGGEGSADFQVVTIANRQADIYSVPTDRHMRQYRIFEHDAAQSVIAYTSDPDDAYRRLRKDFLTTDRNAIGDLLSGIRENIAVDDIRGLSALHYARVLTLKFESLARILDSDVNRRGEPALLGSEGEVMLETLWEHFQTARMALINGKGIPEGFDASNQSLMLFLGRPGTHGLHLTTNNE